MSVSTNPGERAGPPGDPTGGAGAAGGAIPDGPPTSVILEQLSLFEGPPEAFLEFLLHAQCRMTGAGGAAVLRTNENGVVQVVSATPDAVVNGAPAEWLKQTGDMLADRATVLKGPRVLPVQRGDELYDSQPGQSVVLIPLRRPGGMRGAAAYTFGPLSGEALAQAQQELELTLTLLGQYELRLSLQRRQADLRLATGAMEVVSSVQQHERFRKAAMALTNEVASRWKATRVSLGMLPMPGARHLKLAATSHAEQFSRKMRLVQDLEAAMEECLDQGIEVMLPCPPNAPIVNRQHQHLSKQQGPCHVVSLPLRRLGEVEGVLTVEFDPQRALAAADLEGLRILSDLVSPFLFELYRRDRWVGFKAAEATRRFGAGLVGPRHTWAKLTAIGVTLFLLFTLLYPAPHRVDAPFMVESSRRHVVTAPFDGYLADVHVSVGEQLDGEGHPLAEMETAELRLELAAAQAEYTRFLREADLARREGKTAEAQIAEAQAEGVAAQLDVTRHKIERARIVAPVAGVIAEGDLKRRIGSAVSRGDTLFEIVRLADLEAELAVPEARIGDINKLLAGDAPVRGTLAAASHPGRYLGFTVTRVEPVAEVVDGRNIFKVQAKFDASPEWLRPGVEGLAKVDAGHAPYLWLWTRDAVNWVRMKLWL